MVGSRRDIRSNIRERGFCATLFQTARKLLILNGELSEWLKEHAWKACVGETLPRVRIPLSPPIPRFVRFDAHVERLSVWPGRSATYPKNRASHGRGGPTGPRGLPGGRLLVTPGERGAIESVAGRELPF